MSDKWPKMAQMEPFAPSTAGMFPLKRHREQITPFIDNFWKQTAGRTIGCTEEEAGRVWPVAVTRHRGGDWTWPRSLNHPVDSITSPLRCTSPGDSFHGPSTSTRPMPQWVGMQRGQGWSRAVGSIKGRGALFWGLALPRPFHSFGRFPRWHRIGRVIKTDVQNYQPCAEQFPSRNRDRRGD